MKDFIQLAQTRRSVRSYTQEPVSNEDMQYIMECARIAPSAVNFQPWHFYIVRTPELQAKMRQTYSREWFNTAPLYIVGCIRHDQSWHRRFDQKDHGDIDIAIATEHICLAAAERGLGTCWVCNFDAPLCHSLLELPDNEEAAVIIPIGHPDPAEEVKRTTRKPMEDILTEL